MLLRRSAASLKRTFAIAVQYVPFDLAENLRSAETDTELQSIEVDLGQDGPRFDGWNWTKG
jgi:hypothetical protein